MGVVWAVFCAGEGIAGAEIALLEIQRAAATVKITDDGLMAVTPVDEKANHDII